MCYVADILTASRYLFAVVVMALILIGDWKAAFVCFLVAILSDALDGIIARKWRYKPDLEAKLFWRRNPHLFDNIGDGLLTILVSFVAMTIAIRGWWYVAAGVMVGGTIILQLAKLKLTGRNFVMLDRFYAACVAGTYLLTLAVIAGQAFNAKSAYILTAVFVAAGLAYFWVDRRYNPNRSFN